MPRHRGTIPPPVMNTVVVSDGEIKKARECILKTGDKHFGRTINNMLKSRFRILYIRGHEEARIIEFFKNVSIYRGCDLFQWDCDRGLLNTFNKQKVSTEILDIILSQDCP